MKAATSTWSLKKLENTERMDYKWSVTGCVIFIKDSKAWERTLGLVAFVCFTIFIDIAPKWPRALHKLAHFSYEDLRSTNRY